MLSGPAEARTELLLRLLAADTGALNSGLVLEEDGRVLGYGAMSPAFAQRRPSDLREVSAHARALLTPRAALAFVWGYARLQSLVCAPLPHGTAQIHSLVIDPALRGDGRGTRLLGALEDLAAGSAHHTALLYCLAGNPAVRLYQRHGYRVVPPPASGGARRFLRHPGAALARPLAAAVTAGAAAGCARIG